MTPDETRAAMAEELQQVRESLGRIGAIVEDMAVALEEAQEREAEWQRVARQRLKEQSDRRRGLG